MGCGMITLLAKDIWITITSHVSGRGNVFGSVCLFVCMCVCLSVCVSVCALQT